MIANNKTSSEASSSSNEAVAPELGQPAIYHYEDLEVGQIWTSPSRTISHEDVATFSDLTKDFDPLHEGDLAKNSPFGRPVAHGLLGLSVLAGQSTEHPRAATLALVGISDWQFESPIFFGEIVHVVTEVTAIQPHGRRAGRITWLRKLVSDDGRTLQQGNFITLVASKSRNRSMASSGSSITNGDHRVSPNRPR